MSGYILQGKKADGSMVDIDLAAKYDGDGREISAIYATKAEVQELDAFDPAGNYPSLTAGNATEAVSADKADADGAGNNIQNTYATKTEVNAKANQSALEDVIDGTTTVAKANTANSAASATKASQDGAGNNIQNTYATKAEMEAIPIFDEDGQYSNLSVGEAAHATSADSATSAGSATTATSADSATKAIQDGEGNVISTTYTKNADVQNTVQQLQDGTFVVGKAASATTADSATTANHATFADTATLALADADGYEIKNTYAKKLKTESHRIEPTEWEALTDAKQPFAFSATFTASNKIGMDSIVELFNDQPIIFATYGFAIADISGQADIQGQTVTVYALEQPTATVNLTIGITD